MSASLTAPGYAGLLSSQTPASIVSDAPPTASAAVSPGRRPRPQRRRERPEGLPAWRRLRSTRDFARVERQGVRASGDLVSVTVRPGPGRLGFVVSKKVDNRASERNPVKRRLREITRREKPLFVHRKEGSVDVVVTARAAARNVDFEVLRTEVLRVLNAALLRLSQSSGPSRRR